jgi:hypothetical protein
METGNFDFLKALTKSYAKWRKKTTNQQKIDYIKIFIGFKDGTGLEMEKRKVKNDN